jgi:endonuclease/exonuclease/phosphatase (EEP) superfamily protein YafD
MAPELARGAGPTAPAAAPGRIRIVQLNAWADNADPAGTVRWLMAEHPDVIAVEEISPAVRRDLLAQPGWYAGCATCQVMILSRERPLAVTILRHGPRRLQVMTLTREVLSDARGPYSVIAIHYPRPTRPAFQQRQEQWVSQALAQSAPRDRAILVGDFNSTPWSFCRRRWDAGFGLVRRDRALFSWPTWRATGERRLPPPPLLPIDHVYAGRAWATVSLKRGPVLGSDHFPLVLTLAPVAQPHARAARSRRS